MPKCSVSRRINAPIDRVWQAVTDFENAADRIAAIQKCEVLTDGPVGLGTRFRETRIMFKKEATEEMEITQWDPPHRYVTEAESCGAHYICAFNLKPDGDGTMVDVEFEGQAVKFLAKLLMPLMGFMMKSCIKAFNNDLDDLARHLEGGPTASPQPA